MKTIQKQQAIQLRQQGYSVRDIAQTLKISKGSASIWTRDVQLTEQQIEHLKNKNPVYNKQYRGAKSRQIHARKLRLEYQKTGRCLARQNNILHALACMLYWGEGDKSKNCCGLSNSDPNMMKLFIKFLRNIFNVPNDKISISITCYVDNGLSIDEIEKYWLDTLGLPKTSARKHFVNVTPISSKKLKPNRLPYGTCHLRVCDVKIVQHIYGAIQEYAGFDGDYHLD